MKTYSVSDLQAYLNELIQNAEQGKMGLITKYGKPVFLTIPFNEAMILNEQVIEQKKRIANSKKVSKRQSGQLKGLLKISEDFDTPLPENVLASFYSKHDRMDR